MNVLNRILEYKYYWIIILSIIVFTGCKGEQKIPETAETIYVYTVPYQDSDEAIFEITNRTQINEIIKIINNAKKEFCIFGGRYCLQIRSSQVSHYIFVQDNSLRIDGRTYSAESDLELMIRNLIEKSKE
jgi:hypothetical protein